MSGLTWLLIQGSCVNREGLVEKDEERETRHVGNYLKPHRGVQSPRPLWIQCKVMLTDFNFLSGLNRCLPGRLTKGKEDQSWLCSDCWLSRIFVIDWRPKLTVLLPCSPQTSFWGLLEVSRVKMSSILLAWQPWTMSSLPTSQSGSPSVKSPCSLPLQKVRTRFLKVTRFVSGSWSFMGGI